MERSRAEPDARLDAFIAPHATTADPAANTNGVVFWPVAVFVTLVDLLTKAMAAYALAPRGIPHAVFGDGVRLTLVYNPGAAFGLHLGPYSRWIFLGLTLAVLRVLWRLYRRTPDRDNARVLAIALVCGGAVGNAIDRLRSVDGVVDFLDFGWGDVRWPTFNVADIAVTTGAMLLAWLLWRDESSDAAQSDVAPAALPSALPSAPASESP